MGFGYDFWIERPGSSIDLASWEEYATQRSDLSHVPKSTSEGTWLWQVSGRDDGYLEWHPDGRIIARIPVVDGDEVDDLVALAKGLDAIVRGEGGEVYGAGGLREV